MTRTKNKVNMLSSKNVRIKISGRLSIKSELLINMSDINKRGTDSSSHRGMGIGQLSSSPIVCWYEIDTILPNI